MTSYFKKFPGARKKSHATYEAYKLNKKKLGKKICKEKVSSSLPLLIFYLFIYFL
jgi:hypothetical protein